MKGGVKMKKQVILSIFIALSLIIVVSAQSSFSYIKIKGGGGEVTELNPIDEITSFGGIKKENLKTSLTVSGYQSWFGVLNGYVDIDMVDKTSCSTNYRTRYLFYRRMGQLSCSRRININARMSEAEVFVDNGKIIISVPAKYSITGPISINKPKTVCFSNGNCYDYPSREVIVNRYYGNLDTVEIEVENDKAKIRAINEGTEFVNIEEIPLSYTILR
jgi:hypothetical protein